jgi:hypothetical protein
LSKEEEDGFRASAEKLKATLKSLRG